MTEMFNIDDIEPSLEAQIENLKYYNGDLYHVSIDHSLTELEPRRKEEIHGRGHVAKVSFAPTIHGCIQALVLPDHRITSNELQSIKKDSEFADTTMNHTSKAMYADHKYRFSVYRAVKGDIDSKAIVYFDKTDIDNSLVFDQLMTREVAYLKRIRVEKVGVLDVQVMTDAEYEKTMKGIFLPISTRNTQIDFNGDYSNIALANFKLSMSGVDLERDKANFLSDVAEALPIYIKITQRNTRRSIQNIKSLMSSVKTLR